MSVAVEQVAILGPRANHNRLPFVELLPGKSGSAELARDVAVSVQRELERLNSEFKNYAPAERRVPDVRLLPHAEPSYFPVGVKHRYTRS